MKKTALIALGLLLALAVGVRGEFTVGGAPSPPGTRDTVLVMIPELAESLAVRDTVLAMVPVLQDSIDANTIRYVSDALQTDGAGSYYFLGYREFGGAPWAMSATDSVSLGAATLEGNHAAIIAGDTTLIPQPDTVLVIGEMLTANDYWGVVAAALDTAVIAIGARDSSGTYFETPEKFAGAVKFKRQSDAANARNVNYALIGYWDHSNQDFALRSVEFTGMAGANDTGVSFKVWKHQMTGWMYDNSGAFGAVNIPGLLVKSQDILTQNNDLVLNQHFRFKQVAPADSLTFDGNGSEGLIVEVLTTQNNAVEDASAIVGFQDATVP